MTSVGHGCDIASMLLLVLGIYAIQDVDALVDLCAHDVDRSPTAAVSGSLHGREALRGYLDDLIANATLVAAHPYSFEAVGDPGARRPRTVARPDGYACASETSMTSNVRPARAETGEGLNSTTGIS